MRQMNLLQLMQQNASDKRRWSISDIKNDAVDVFVYDVIGGLFGGVDSEEFARQFAAIEAGTIHLRINSPGGDVFDARAMQTAIKQHSAHVVAHIDGLAASAATGIAVAADEVEMADGGFFMIHNAWTIAIGNKADMTETAGLLDKIDGSINADYVARSGQTAEQITEWMDAESWFTAQEALDAGFIDRLADEGKSNRAAAGRWNLSAYERAPTIENNDDAQQAAAHHAHLARRAALMQRLSP